MRADRAARKSGARREVVRFVVLFGVWAVATHLLLAMPVVDRLFAEPWTGWNVRLAAGMAAPIVDEARPAGMQLIAGDATLQVRKGCDGLGVLSILTAAVLAFPAPRRLKLIGVIGGAAAVFVLNAVRLTTLLFVAVRWPAQLERVHVDVWQPAMVLLAFGLFVIWGARVPLRRRDADAG